MPRLITGYWQRVMSMRFLISIVFMLVASAASAEHIDYQEIRVSDGDTISAHGITYRLVGFDAPETRRAKCNVERAMGYEAARRLRQILANAESLDLVEVRCSCRPSTHGTRDCNHGRSCALLSADGEDVGDVLISEGLARPYHCAGNRCPAQETWC